MHLGHEVGAGLDQDLVAALEVGPAEVLGFEAEHLQVGPHGAVEDHHALAQGLEVVGGGRIEPAQQFGRGRHESTQLTGAPRCAPTGPVASDLVKPRIYTKTGDGGTTGLLFGGRVPQGLVADRAQRRRSTRPSRPSALARAETAAGLRGPRPADRAGPRPLRRDGRGGHRPGEPDQVEGGVEPGHRGHGGRARGQDRRPARALRHAGRLHHSGREPAGRRAGPGPGHRAAGRAPGRRRADRGLLRDRLPQPALGPAVGHGPLAGRARAQAVEERLERRSAPLTSGRGARARPAAGRAGRARRSGGRRRRAARAATAQKRRQPAGTASRAASCSVAPEVAEDAGAEAGVDRGQEHGHHAEAASPNQ